jgi:hypothetical protein
MMRKKDLGISINYLRILLNVKGGKKGKNLNQHLQLSSEMT